MEYDIAIIGGGMSGLSLAKAILLSKKFDNSTICIIDPRVEYSQDKIWSFWNIDNHNYDDIKLHSWNKFAIHAKTSTFVNSKYPYVSINSQLFYQNILEIVNKNDNCNLMLGTKVLSIKEDDEKLILETDKGLHIFASQVFDSRIPEELNLGEYDLLQHFKGLHLSCETAIFDPNELTLMDFRVDQTWGLHFIYVLPLTPTEALIEATWFTKDIVSDEIYEKQLKSYLEGEKISNYKTIYEEKGVIPMSLSINQQDNWNRIVKIGTRGGLTRPSTGYTFLNSQWFAEKLVNEMSKPYRNRVIPKIRSNWIDFMDEVLLRVLSKYPKHGGDIFVRLFDRNDPDRIIRFLSGTSNFKDELIIMLKIPKFWLFVKEGTYAATSKLKFW